MINKKALSHRIQQIRPSGIRRIFDIACANPDGLDLSIGDPDFDIPDPIKAEGIDWIRRGFNHYVSTRGIPELREALKCHLTSRRIKYEDVLVTAGATGAFYLAMMALVSPGDEVLIPDPYFVAYANVVTMCGGVPRLINTYPDFRLRTEEAAPLVTERTKAIVINSPNNPTGIVYTEEELKAVAELSSRHGIYLVSDEIYDRFVYDQPFVSLGNVADDAIVISGFSKTAGMTGWRLGYVSGPATVIDAMATFQQYSYVCANSIAQKAVITALNYDLSGLVGSYHRRMQLVHDGLKDRFNLRAAGGAFFLFPEAPGGDADAFVEQAIREKLYIIPGNVFSARNTHFRLSFAVGEEKLKRAIDILNRIADRF